MEEWTDMSFENRIERLVSAPSAHKLLGALFCWLLPLMMVPVVAAQQSDIAKTSTNASTGDSPPAALTIDQAIEEAIQNNLGLLAERVNLTMAAASLITAKLRPNPVVSFSADHLDLLGTGFSAGNNGGPPEFAWRVDVPMERGHKRHWRIETAEFEKQIAEAQLLDSIRKLKLEVSLACIDVIQAKANLALARDNLRTFEELVRINDVRVKAGSLAPLELTRSQVAMLQFRSTVNRAELELAQAKTKLQNRLGRKTGVAELDVLGDLKAPLRPADLPLASLHEMALVARPDVLTLERTQARSQSELKLQLAQGTVDYTWGVEYRRQQGIAGKSNSLGFFFSIPIPLFNRNQGEIARVRAEQEQLARQAQALKAQALTEVTSAYQEFRSARQLVESIERDLLKPAEQARETVAYVYRTGASSLIEFLDAQRAFNETMQSYNEAQAAYRRAIMNLNAAIGKEVIQ
jgi:cobalt-zinc-cadmium efflux system outer membrane protein